jgi:predicted nucleotidyltransferase
MGIRDRVSIPDRELAEICRRYQVRELSLFGSVLRDDFRDDSDIDVLVEFESDAAIGFFELSRLQRELTALIGRPVDVVSKRGLNPVIRNPVLAAAVVLYAI